MPTFCFLFSFESYNLLLLCFSDEDMFLHFGNEDAVEEIDFQLPGQNTSVKVLSQPRFLWGLPKSMYELI